MRGISPNGEAIDRDRRPQRPTPAEIGQDRDRLVYLELRRRKSVTEAARFCRVSRMTVYRTVRRLPPVVRAAIDQQLKIERSIQAEAVRRLVSDLD